MTTPTPSLAERKRQLVVDELTEAALRVLAAKGFDATTVDEMVAAAGVSRRTYFRYFASKEDVVVRLLADLGAVMRAELQRRPPDEPAGAALRHAVAAAVADWAGQPDRALRVVRMVLHTPALHASFLQREAQWRDDLAALLISRTPGRGDLYPQLAAGIALTVFHAVLQRWCDSNGTADPMALLDRAFVQVAPAL
ncbi:TetR family transcriptional regulator [Paractinoplanes rishiriensis]|nr:TetR family transcriptional regulator [Actinoplanes rishiriensis]